MGKSKKPKTEVTEYSMSEHFGVCIGPPDALLALTINEKQAWAGEQTDPGTISIDNADLFGGVKKEGGVRGTVHYLPGNADQVLPDALAVKLGRTGGADCPGFRGFLSLFFVGSDRPGFYWTANTPYLPGVWATVRRILKRSDGTDQWYPEKALIGLTRIAVTGEVVVSFWQKSYSGEFVKDANRVGILFLDNLGNAVGSIIWSDPANGSTSWTQHSVSATAPEEATGLRVYIRISKGFGSHPHYGFIDDVTLTIDGTDVPLANPGAEDGVNGWTDTTSFSLFSLPTTDTVVPRSGNFMFGGENTTSSSGEIRAYQTVDLITGDPTGDMNPAHIIHECLTDTTWGMGTPEAALDDASFRAAADELFVEQFGLSLIWTRQTTIEAFVQEVLDHIQAVLFVDPSTGLLTLKLVRGDYDVDTLGELTPDNADLTSFSRKLWGDIVNEIVVTWTNPVNEQDETITAQDLASISTQGGVVSDSRNYYGVRNADLAQSLAFRDLRSAGQPLAACEAEVDRTQWQLRPASVVKLTWPEYGISEIVMRVTSVDYGKPGDMTIKLSLVEDVYGLDIGTYESPPSTIWEDPSAAPAPLTTVEIFTLPLFLAADTTVSAFVDTPEYPEVLAGVLATTDDADTYGYELWDEVALPNGDLEWQSLGTNNIIGRGTLDAALGAEALSTGVLFDGLTGQTAPTVGGFAIIGDDGETGNEIALIDADNGDTYGFDLVRGVLDTVPRAWPAGTPVWFVDGETLFEDPLVRSAAEEVSYKLLTRTSQGLLALGDASLESYTLTERPWLPNRPANVTAYGESWSSEAAPIDARTRPDPWVTCTWANRNRLTEDSQVLAWTDATVTPEDGQTTRIEVLAVDGTSLATHDGLTGTSFDVPDASLTQSIVRLQFYADRSDDDGDFASLQFFEHWVQVSDLTFDSTAVTFDSDTWTMDNV